MLTNAEKTIIKTFQQTRIPSIYKFDETDNILYIEHVEFDLCNMLLKEKKARKECVQNEIKEYALFLSKVSISNYNDSDKTHLKLLMEVINIFIRNNL